MKYIYKYLIGFSIGYYFCIILSLYLGSESEFMEVKIPSKENSIKITNPIPEIRIDTVEVEVLVNGKKTIQTKIIEVENPINQELLNKYEVALKEKDSIKQLKLYTEAITEKIYIETLQDSIQDITVKSEVIGTLKSQLISYKTKNQIVKLKVQKNRINFFAGTFIKIPTTPTQNPSVGIRLNVIKNKNNFSTGYDNQKNIFIGYAYKLF